MITLKQQGIKLKMMRKFGGFTMVELSLAMIFISVLAIAVVMVMSGAISSYHRSITLNKINTVGTELVDEMRSAVQNAPSGRLSDECYKGYSGSAGLNACLNDGGKNLAMVTRYAKVFYEGNPVGGGELPVYGAFCTGDASFIWNSGYMYNNEYTVDGVAPAVLTYNSGKIGIGGFKLLKVKDKDRKVCLAALQVRNGVATDTYTIGSGASINNGGNMFDLTPYGDIFEGEDFDVLLDEVDEELALYNLTTKIAEQKGLTKSTYYYSSFILGTVQGGVNINASGNFCATQNSQYETMENLDYCAINKFNFAAMATGG